MNYWNIGLIWLSVLVLWSCDSKPKESEQTSTVAKNKSGLFSDIPWNYQDQSAWVEAVSGAGTCQSGTYQSPIDIIEVSTNLGLEAIDIIQPTGELDLALDRYSIVGTSTGKIEIIFQHHIWELESVSWHFPAEHKIKGESFLGEIITHWKSDKSEHPLLLSILLREGVANRALAQILPKLQVNDQNKLGSIAFNINHILPKPAGYFYYQGSLSHPPCSEPVERVVMKFAIPISNTQLKDIKVFLPDNARSIQANEIPVFEY